MKNVVALLNGVSVRQDVFLISLIMTTLAMMVLRMAAIYLKSPSDFTKLPSAILISTISRLSISITTCRLVLTQADASAIASQANRTKPSDPKLPN